MVAKAEVRVANLDQLKRRLERDYGPGAMRRKGAAALTTAAKAELVPAIIAEIPASNPTSPWRRGVADNPKMPGPMKQRVKVKSARLRAGEVAAIHVGIRHYATNVVIRGSVAHDQPNHPFRKRHPGSKPNDIIGKAARRSLPAFVKAVQDEIGRL